MTQPRRLRDLADLTDIVHELTSPRQHRQSYRAGWTKPNRTGPVIRDHITNQPSLLDQLRAAITDRADSATAARAGKMVYTNLPRFSADAYDRMQAIRDAVTRWAASFGYSGEANRRADLLVQYLDQIQRIINTSGVMNYPVSAALDTLRTTASVIRVAIDVDLRALLKLAARLTATELDELTRDAERWRTWCRIMAGWETPALRPHVPCPQCGVVAGERAGLRVRIDAASGAGGIVDDAAVRAAVCLSCNQTWDAETVSLLAEQLRHAGQLLDGTA